MKEGNREMRLVALCHTVGQSKPDVSEAVSVISLPLPPSSLSLLLPPLSSLFLPSLFPLPPPSLCPSPSPFPLSHTHCSEAGCGVSILVLIAPM